MKLPAPDLERYSEQAHYYTLGNWYVARKMSIVPAQALPPTGYVVPGVAAGFCWHTNSTVAWIDNMITNPAAPVIRRYAALQAIVLRLEAEAIAAGHHHLMILGQLRGVQKWLRRDRWWYGGQHHLYMKG